jgi:hypothetical protein
MTAPVNESAAPTFDVEIPHTAGVASSREPTPPSVPIVSVHDSNTTTTRAGGGALREPVMDQTTTKRVSRSAYATQVPCSFLTLLPFLLPLPCMVSCCESVSTSRTLANPSFFFSETGYPLVCRHRGRAQALISRFAPRTPALHVSEDALLLLSNSLLIVAHVPLQTYLDFNVIYIVYP